MPELPSKDPALLLLVVIRRVGPEGAVLEDIQLMSHWDDTWSYDDFRGSRKKWNFYNLLAAAGNSVDKAFHDRDDAFESLAALDVEGVVTNVYPLKLNGDDAALFKALINLLDRPEEGDLSDWLEKIARLNIGKADSDRVQTMLGVLLKQAVMLNIPRVIPLGKSEKDFEQSR